MKNTLNVLSVRVFGIIAALAIIGFSFAACGGDDGGSGGGGNKDLTGTITISPSTSVTTNTELTATYSGTETVSYQWKNDSTNVGTNSNKFTPTEAGSYTVTVSAEGYKSKTSNAVTVIFKPQWTAVSGFSANSSIYSITYGGDKFVAGNDSGEMATSTDGITWTKVVNTTGPINAIAYGNNTFVAGGSHSSYYGRIAYSTDGGTTWTSIQRAKQTISGYSGIFDSFGKINAIAYGNGTFVAGGSGMVISTDCTTWTVVEGFSLGTDINAIVFVNNKFIIYGYGGKMATSTDGTTWTAVAGSSFNFYRIAYGNGKFVAGNLSGEMATSTDGTTWTAVADSTFGTSGIYAIAYGNGKFFAGGKNGIMASSTDGAMWTAEAKSIFGTSESKKSYDNIRAIAYGNNKFVAVGDNYDYSYKGKIAYLSDN